MEDQPTHPDENPHFLPAALLAATLLHVAPQMACAQNGVTDGATYFIVARHSGKVLDVTAASTANGAVIQQWTKGGGPNQQFTFKRQADGSYRILAKHSGKCMYLPDGRSADGVEIQQYDCMDETYGYSAYQKFWVDPVGDGYVKIRTALGKVIDIAGVATNDGAKLHQWEYVGGQNQQFKLEPTSDSKGGTNTLTVIKGHNVGNVGYAEQGGGRFVRIAPRSWVERNPTGAYNFTETGRDEWSVYLRDEARKISIQLDLYRKKVSMTPDGGGKMDLYNIRETN
ncbi:MAG: RICIN domain-containing protein [Flavobacteriales bacterium]|nr:RICIN domain-containing protein [Flavobacteriales bacterium]